MTTLPVNEIRVETQSSGGINPFTSYDSGAREQMLGGHLSQALVIEGATTRRCLTGIEREFGRYTFNVHMPCDAEIIRVVQKFPTTLGRNSIRENPLYTIVFEDVQTNCIDVLQLPRHHSRHQHFGFPYKFKSAVNRLMPGALIPKGTILADSPAIDDLGNYRLGLETNVAFMSVPGIIEDGVVVSEDYVKRLTTYGYETLTASWGEHYYPLNLYGSDDEYKPFPDIGDRVNDAGVLFALRRYNDLLGPIQMTAAALRRIDHTFDRCYWAKPGALIKDISVRHDVRRNPPDTPVGMEGQCRRYYEAENLYYDTLISIYNDLKRKRGNTLNISPRFHALLVTAYGYKPDPAKMRIGQMVKLQPLDDWRVEVTFETKIVPTVGFKLTDFHGGKGVICEVRRTEDMPIDEEGNRADCIMDGDSTIKRMNIGRMYEQHINATSRHVSNQVRRMMSNTRSPEAYDQAWQYLLGYYRIVSPRFFDLITGPTYTKPPQAHVDDIVKDGVYLWMPTDNPVYMPEMIRSLMDHYPFHLGPVKYRGQSGIEVTTKKNILIASIYVMLLEKTSTYDWSGVASAKLNPHGIAARLTQMDRNAAPGRPQPVRLAGESESRLFAATIGGMALADLLDKSNNPRTHKMVVDSIIRAENPMDIARVVDRSVQPLGHSRSILHVNHILECAGISMYRPDSTLRQLPVYTEE